MSIIFRDPFFDGFDDLLVSTYPRQNDLDSWFDDGIRRDVITPFSGFGRMDMKENEKEYEQPPARALTDRAASVRRTARRDPPRGTGL